MTENTLITKRCKLPLNDDDDDDDDNNNNNNNNLL